MTTRPIVYVEDTRPTMHYGAGAPSGALGADGDTYLDIPGLMIYGPKAVGAWGAGTSIKGEKGDTGDKGDTGASGSIAAVATGTIQPFAGLTAPSGNLWANGQAVARATYGDLFSVLTSVLGTCTMTVASPCVVTRNSHGLVDGDGIYFTSTGSLPTGLSQNTSYYVLNATANTFQVSATRGGSAINTSGSQSGTHSIVRAPWGGVTATNFAVPDLRGRVLVGLDDMSGSDAGRLTVPNALGAGGGAEQVTLDTSQIPSHSHGVTDPTHTHPIGIAAAGSGQAGLTPVASGAPNFAGGYMSQAYTGISINANGGGGAHNNMPPYALLNYIIKT